MNRKIILIAVVLIFTILVVVFITRSSGEKSAHDAFMGDAPTPSKPYNILDYTKPTH